MKNDRQRRILEIVEQEPIDTQEQLQQKLLEQGVPPVEAALQTGFSDQSHFTNYFSRFIGLTPGAYQEIFSKGRGNLDGLAK